MNRIFRFLSGRLAPEPRNPREVTGRRASRGQGTVEFALIAPLLLFVIFTIFDASFYFFTTESLGEAAREGARYGVVHGYNVTNPANQYQVCSGSPGFSCTLNTCGDELCNVVRRAMPFVDDSKVTIMVNEQGANLKSNATTCQVLNSGTNATNCVIVQLSMVYNALPSVDNGLANSNFTNFFTIQTSSKLTAAQ